MNTESKKCSIYKLSPNGGIVEASLEGERLSCALGCFDGIHIGHKKLLNIAVNNPFGYTPAVWTFSKPICTPFIENIPERLSICGKIGIDRAVCEEFENVKKMTPKQFVTHLHDDFGVRHFVCGEDFRFGADRAGDAKELGLLAKALGDETTVVPVVKLTPVEDKFSGEKVSSSVLRKMIAAGDVENASKILGRRFGLTASVCDGKHIGRIMGMPTINQRFEAGRVVPAHGVYYSVAVYDGMEHFAVTNIGVRPTVNSDVKDLTCETHILDVNADLYGKTVRVELCRYARAEQKFNGLEELKTAIVGDICGAKVYFGIALSDR